MRHVVEGTFLALPEPEARSANGEALFTAQQITAYAQAFIQKYAGAGQSPDASGVPMDDSTACTTCGLTMSESRLLAAVTAEREWNAQEEIGRLRALLSISANKTSIELPAGLSREEKRQFIISHAVTNNGGAQGAAARNHVLKTDPEVFDAVARGDKTHEIRLNDRDFTIGDGLILLETRYTGAEMREGQPLEYTGRVEERIVSHIQAGCGLGEGWVILSFANREAPAPGTLDIQEAWMALGENPDVIADKATLLSALNGIRLTAENGNQGASLPDTEWIEDALSLLSEAESRIKELEAALDGVYPKDADEKTRWRAAGHYHRINSKRLWLLVSIQDARRLLAAQMGIVDDGSSTTDNRA